MKKIVAILLAALMVLMSITACSQDKGPERLVLSTAGTSGVYYIFGGEIAAMLNEHIDGVEITTQSSDGSKANILALQEGEADIAWTQNDVMSYAYAGTDDFGGKPIDDFSAIGSIYPEVIQIVVAKDSGIKSVADLKGKNVGIGAVGSYFNAVQVLELAGMTLDDIQPQYLSFAESAESFQNRQLDAFFVVGAYPHASVVDAAYKRDIDILSFSDEEIAALQEMYSFYVSDVIPAGTYEGLDSEVKVPAISAVLVASNDLSEETVYQITKNLFENVDELTNSKKEYMSLETAVQGIPISQTDAANGVTDGSFHPGARKYYEEQGILE